MLLDTPKQFPTVKEMSEWVYDALKARGHGEMIPYADLSSVLTIDAQDDRGRRAVLAAGRRLLREHSKLLVNVKNVGYHIAQPGEHAGHARRFHHAARRRLVRAVACATYVLMEQLTPEERSRVLAEQLKAGLALAFSKTITRRKALPPKEQIALPSGAKLVRLLTRKMG